MTFVFNVVGPNILIRISLLHSSPAHLFTATAVAHSSQFARYARSPALPTIIKVSPAKSHRQIITLILKINLLHNQSSLQKMNLNIFSEEK